MVHLQMGLEPLEVKQDDRCLLLFDLSIYGHHPAYIRHLLNYWHQQGLPGRLTIVVSPRFFSEHEDVLKLGQKLSSEAIQFVAITEAEEASLKPRSSSISRNIRNFQEWQLFRKYAQQLQADHALVMYYDTYQYYLALQLNPPCPVSGIYFRPTFHYSHLSNNASSVKESLRTTWEKLILNQVLKNPGLHSLFSLDPFVTKYIEEGTNPSKVVYLPDPVEIHQEAHLQSSHIREQLGIAPHRKLFLLFGALTGRKGIDRLLDAIPLLPPNLCEQLAIAMIGEASENYQQQIESRVRDLVQNYPVQIVRHYQFVPEEDVHQYFQSADVVLAPYQRHVGMSGILIQAAAAQKPVLSSDYGLMGAIVRRYSLGLAVDTTLPQEIARGLIHFLSGSPDGLCDRSQMQYFAEQNSAERFAETIFHRLIPQSL